MKPPQPSTTSRSISIFGREKAPILLHSAVGGAAADAGPHPSGLRQCVPVCAENSASDILGAEV
jgi:hypothetical protein